MEEVEALNTEVREAREEGVDLADIGVDADEVQEAIGRAEELPEALQTVRDLRKSIR